MPLLEKTGVQGGKTALIRLMLTSAHREVIFCISGYPTKTKCDRGSFGLCGETQGERGAKGSMLTGKFAATGC